MIAKKNKSQQQIIQQYDMTIQNCHKKEKPFYRMWLQKDSRLLKEIMLLHNMKKMFTGLMKFWINMLYEAKYYNFKTIIHNLTMYESHCFAFYNSYLRNKRFYTVIISNGH